MNDERLVLTGAGVVTAVGTGLADFLDGLTRAPMPAPLPGTDGDVPGLAVPIADFDPRAILQVKGLRNMSRTARLACGAASLALTDAGLDSATEGDTIGIVGGTVYGNVGSIARFGEEVASEGPRFVDAMLFPNTVLNSAAGFASIALGVRSLNSTVSAGRVTGVATLDYAARLLRRGRARAILAGGYEELCPGMLWGFHADGQLTAPRGRSGGRPLPYGAERDGTVLGEGAALLTVETAAVAAERRAGPVTRVLGLAQRSVPARTDGGSADLDLGGDPTAAERLEHAYADAMSAALRAAEIEPALLGGFLGAAGGDPRLDGIESRALRRALGATVVNDLPLLPLKAVLGETVGAHAALAIAAAHGLLHRGELPVVGDYPLDSECGRERLGGTLRHPTVLVGALDPAGLVGAVVLGGDAA